VQANGNLKAIMQQRYDKIEISGRTVNLQIEREQFVVCNDFKRDIFTCIFECPVLGKLLFSGWLKYFTAVEGEGLNWYETEKKAMETAAAQVLDSFRFLESPSSEVIIQFCVEAPYEYKRETACTMLTGVPQ
jgi:hypothetical protein